MYGIRCDEASVAAYIADVEGTEPDSPPESPAHSEFDERGREQPQFLIDNAFLHSLGNDQLEEPPEDSLVPADQFTLQGRYSEKTFQGILPDTGAAEFSTAGHGQFLALRRDDPQVKMDLSRAGEAVIRFGKGTQLTSIGTTTLGTPIGDITFHVINSPTPFLLCMKDMDKLGVFLRNTTNELVQHQESGPDKVVPVVRKWGHPWFFVAKREAGAFLTETEPRRLHRRFGHPAVDRLNRLLKDAGHDPDPAILETISQFCHQCQLKGASPRRFKFTLKDDCDFNYEIFVDVLYLDGEPVLHVVDGGTSFQAGRFLPSLSTKDTWEALRAAWVDTYLGPPDHLVHDAGTNFASSEFRNEAKFMGITCRQVPTEAHWSIGKVERYHGPLRRAFEILTAEIGTICSKEAILQMAFKAVNDTAGPDGLIPTLLVFGAFPRINLDSPPTPSTLKRAEAVAKAMRTLRKHRAERQVRDALAARNGPDTSDVLSAPLQSEMLVWREKDGWQGPYNLA